MTKISVNSETCTFLEVGLLFDEERGRSFCVGAKFVAPVAAKLLLGLASTRHIGSLCSLGTIRIEYTGSNSFSISACACCIAMALVLLRVYIAVA
jgi:hypothetical protein